LVLGPTLVKPVSDWGLTGRAEINKNAPRAEGANTCMTDKGREEAQALFEAGDFRRCREVALAELAGTPDDVELLRLAGRAGVELGSEDAVAQLRRVAELQPDAAAWRDLGDALAAEGDSESANQAFRKVLEFDPLDEVALTGLGHLAYTTGDRDDALSLLSRAAEHGSRASTAMISLVDMYRTVGQTDEALAAARKLSEAAPDDLAAALDVADLSLEVGKLDEAADAFARIRELDDVPGHEVYPLHGLIDVEIHREAWDSALALATEATALEPVGRSAEVAAFLQAQVAGPGEQPAPSAQDIEAALTASRTEYRRLLADDRNLPAGPPA
jgi:Flp pilus assembly protein TadD